MGLYARLYFFKIVQYYSRFNIYIKEHRFHLATLRAHLDILVFLEDSIGTSVLTAVTEVSLLLILRHPKNATQAILT